MKRVVPSLMVVAMAFCLSKPAPAQTLADYTAYPAFLSNAVPPLVMLVMSRDHRLFYKAYTDVADLDENGALESTYTDTIDYYGYFDFNKCYTYSTGNSRFEPSAAATGANTHYCSGAWSGNFLNWATMTRIDLVRKVLYGGRRTVDTNSTTVLSRARLPQDAHSWAKVYNGGDIASLIPLGWSSITLCNTNTDASENAGLIYIKNGFYPYAASTEGRQCLWTEQGGVALSPDYTYVVSVKVCVTGLLEANCEQYKDSGTTIYKPTGLMQKFGVNRQGTVDPSDDVVQMKFGLMTGSYGENDRGGVVRSEIVDLDSEIDPNKGTIKSTSNIIKNIDNFRIVQYDYSSGWYTVVGPGECKPKEPYSLAAKVNSDDCASWGNPVGEMLYETIRFFQGQSGPTSEFVAAQPDLGLSGLTVESSWTDPYSTCPYCSQPFALILSDAFTSFDSDHLPGSYWPQTISTSDTPSVQTLIANSDINALEGIGNVFIGQSGGTYDLLCTSKAGDFASIRGLCVEEPTKEGAYYLAGLAHYAKTTDLRPEKGEQKLTTYSVVTGSAVPSIEFDVGGQKVVILPELHDGCPDTTFPGCTAQGVDGDNSKGQVVDFQICQPTDAEWITEQGNGFTSCFDVMWDDAEYGWDYELDARYHIYVKSGAGTITVKTKGLYAAAGHEQYVGYSIRGVTSPGQYYDMICGGDADFDDCDSFNPTTKALQEKAEAERTFTVNGSTSGFLKDPMWYAAKYGGFKDKDGSNTPNLQKEWDEDGDGVPDTYFNAANPLKLELKLADAFLSILNRASSGSAASVLASSSTGEGALYQSFFFPTFFEGLDEIKWTGATQGLFLDAFGNLREDTNGDAALVYEDDLIVRPRFDITLNQVMVDRFADSDGNGLADSGSPQSTVGLRDMSPIWEAGLNLATMSSCSRNILSWVDLDGDGLVDGGEEIEFNATCAGKTSHTAKLAPYLRAGAAPYTAENIINFIRGDQITGMRGRLLTVGGSKKVWKLSDPVHAQPILVGPPTQRYDLIYGDASYTDFFSAYKDRRHVAYVGANDGMLHAFNAGFFHRGDDPGTSTKTEHGYFTTTQSGITNTPPLGDELWGFIPQELLPHLQWLTRPDYTHVYYVDLSPKVTEARIFCDAGGNAPATCVTGQSGAAHPNGWGTILMGGFRMGGSCGGCTSGTGAPPMTLTGDFDNNAVTPDETRTFYSAYFVLDVTDPEQDPKLLWSFSDPDLGLTTTRPSMLRVNPASAGTTDHASAKWYMIVGSGPTGYDGSIAQASQVFAFDLATGPGAGNANVKAITADSLNSFLSDTVTVDKNLDYRVDVAYTGGTIHDGSLPWRGKLYRLTMNDCPILGCSPDSWGIALGATDRQATELLDTFVDDSATTLELGPVTAAPAVAADQSNKLWVFAGTGRLFDTTDRTNTDPQYFVGIKDSVLTAMCTETTRTNCHEDDLVDMSSAEVCLIGVGTCGGTTDQVTGVTSGGGASDFPSLIALVASKDGWFTTLPNSGERALSRPLAFGGLVLFPTFVPNDDPCSLNGESYMYALYYLTGSAYSSPVIGTTTSGSNKTVNRSTSLGVGMASQAVVHIGKSGSGGKMTAYVQKSSGELSSMSIDSADAITSRFVTWYDARD